MIILNDQIKEITAGTDGTDAVNLTQVTGLIGSATVALDQGTITRAAATASGTQAVTCSFSPSFVVFSSVDDSNVNTNSDGWDTGTTKAVVTNLAQNFLLNLLGAVTGASLSTKAHDKSIWIQNIGGDGHSASISAKSSTSFTLNWTKIGNGRAITVKWYAVK